MRKIPAIDLLVFWALIGTIGVAHSLLLTAGSPWETTTWFYIMVWVSSMIILLACRIFYKEEEQFDYDEPLTQKKIYYLLGGLAATILISSILVRAYTQSAIWVPQPHMELAVGTFSLSAVVNDLFYQLALVSNSEETMNLSLSQVLRRKLKGIKILGWEITGMAASILAIIIPRGGWGILHAYVSYVGSMMWILVISAFISGCVISYCAYNNKVKSFLVAVLIHAFFNWAVVIARALGVI